MAAVSTITDIIGLMDINSAPHWEIKNTGHGQKTIAESPQNPNLDLDQSTALLKRTVGYLGAGRYNIIMRTGVKGPENTRGSNFTYYFQTGDTAQIAEPPQIGGVPSFDQEAALRREFELQRKIDALEFEKKLDDLKRDFDQKQEAGIGGIETFMNSPVGQQLGELIGAIAANYAGKLMNPEAQEANAQSEPFEGV